MIGDTLGRYRLIEQIGAGGMGVVYRARDERLDRDVAVKVLPPGALADDEARKRFRKEALALSKLNYPNVATVHDFDTQDGVDFLVMEWIPGVTLSDRVARGPLAEREIVQIGAQLATGLAAAHAGGVVHRDLKPGNLRLTPDGRLKILDFGLARVLKPESELLTTRTVTGMEAAGTLPYMAPEQVRGQAVDPRADIYAAGYAAGAVLYELATGQRVFAESRGIPLLDAILNRAPTPPRAVNPATSASLEGIILKALDKDPERRFQSAGALEVALEGLRMAAPAPGARPARQLRAAGIAAGLGGLLIGVGAAILALNLWDVRARILGRPGPSHIESIAVLPLAIAAEINVKITPDE